MRSWPCPSWLRPRRGRRAMDVVAVAVTSLTSWPWRPSRPGRGRVMAVTVWFLYRCVVVATRRRMLVFLMGLRLDLRNKIVACILITTARRTAKRGTARPGERQSEPLRFDNSRADAMKIRRNAAGRGLTLKDRTAETSRSRNEWRGVRHGIAPRCMSGLQWPHPERM